MFALPTETLVELSRWQFALTAMYHFIMVPLTLGLSWILFIMESVYVMTGRQVYKDMTRFWGKLFGINFALGVTTGITMEFQFGTNWAYYSHYVGDIFGAPLAIEGLMAFFLESTFVGLFFFGWDRLSKQAHLLTTFLVALGSNRGDSVAIVRQAMTRLETFAAGGVRRSSLWLTSPVDCPPDAADFVNAVVAFEARPDLTPETLLAGLKALERVFGRTEVTVRNAPRELDLDLLVFADARRNTPTFVLPHPRGHLRRFVLAPAAEVAPEVVWPGIGRSIAELLAGLTGADEARRLM